MSKPIITPQQYSITDVYAEYALKLLKDNPTWHSKYNVRLKRSNSDIYAPEGPIKLRKVVKTKIAYRSKLVEGVKVKYRVEKKTETIEKYQDEVLKMSWGIWKEIIERFYFEAKDAIIRGETLQLGSNLGKIRAVRIERDFTKPKVNVAQTFQKNLKDAEGNLVLIYHTDPDYCRIQWAKNRTITNEAFYNFIPAKSRNGNIKSFKRDFSNALIATPMLKYKYKFIPVKHNKKLLVCNTTTTHSVQ